MLAGLWANVGDVMKGYGGLPGEMPAPLWLQRDTPLATLTVFNFASQELSASP
jgi:hypothetical protein